MCLKEDGMLFLSLMLPNNANPFLLSFETVQITECIVFKQIFHPKSY